MIVKAKEKKSLFRKKNILDNSSSYLADISATNGIAKS